MNCTSVERTKETCMSLNRDADIVVDEFGKKCSRRIRKMRQAKLQIQDIRSIEKRRLNYVSTS